jgi:hypothetical protein
VDDRDDVDLVALGDAVLDHLARHRDLGRAELELTDLAGELVGARPQLARGELDLGQRR